MKYTKKYTIVEKRITKIDDGSNFEVNLELSYGKTDGPYYSQTYPEEIFDTEEEAIEYAYNRNKYIEYLIIPVITFNN